MIFLNGKEFRQMKKLFLMRKNVMDVRNAFRFVILGLFLGMTKGTGQYLIQCYVKDVVLVS